ncbi:hypothetical protein [Homoserinibacter sp. GY 40078]|uniref:hypothetical protein n=1 Tax=Homoserinibacter sp. GY 40078 TaxID=2603275 RepID=UPI0011C74026|nr:hypothetical protein [Homoserinibacter sp. GY 40078]TXK18988.1 hypothetical protein FVQ89_03385 [Homoserinibacter sp. GY 40078]
MKLAAIAREVAADVASGAARVVTFALLAALIAGGLSLVDVLAIRALVAEARDFRASGAATLILTAEGRIDGDACRALGAIDGVVAAGASRQRPEGLSADALPHAPITVYETTPGFGGVLDASAPGTAVAGEVAEAIGAREGDRVSTAEGPLWVGGIVPPQAEGSRAGLGWSVFLETTGRAPFDECWVLAWPPSDVVRGLLMATAEQGHEAPRLGQLNTSLGSGFDGTAQLEARITSAVPAVAFVALAALGVVSVRLRRLALASDLHAGARRRDIAAIVHAQALCWLAPALLLTLGLTALAVAPEAYGDRMALLTVGARVALASLAGGITGVGAGVATIREHQLLRYFRDR